MTEQPSNNPPFASVDFTEDQFYLLVRHCNKNLHMSLAMLQGVQSRDLGDKLVELIEGYRGVRDALRRARPGDRKAADNFWTDGEWKEDGDDS